MLHLSLDVARKKSFFVEPVWQAVSFSSISWRPDIPFDNMKIKSKFDNLKIKIKFH